MKKVLFIVAVILLPIVFTSCEDDYEAQGTKAAKEFCDCLKKSSFSKCNDNFKKKYEKNTSQDFIDAFNEEGKKCNISVSRL